MKIEHKTEKGTVLFVLKPEEASDLTYPKVGMINLYFQTKVKAEYEEDNYISIGLPDIGFKLIGLTSELTEEQAKIIVDSYYGKSSFRNYIGSMMFDCSLDSFKSLMKHLQITDEKWIVLFKPND